MNTGKAFLLLFVIGLAVTVTLCGEQKSSTGETGQDLQASESRISSSHYPAADVAQRRGYSSSSSGHGKKHYKKKYGKKNKGHISSGKYGHSSSSSNSPKKHGKKYKGHSSSGKYGHSSSSSHSPKKHHKKHSSSSSSGR